MKHEPNSQRAIETENRGSLQWSSVPPTPEYGLSFPVTKRYFPLGLPILGHRTFDYGLLISMSSPELLLSSQFLICTYRVPLGGFSWSPVVSVFCCCCFSELPFSQDGHFDLMNQLQHFWSAARLSGRQLSWASIRLFKEPSGLPAGCLLCSFFLLINAFILSEWPVLKHSNWVIDVFCCVFFWNPPYLPRLDLIGVCSLWFKLILPLGMPYIKSCSPLRKPQLKIVWQASVFTGLPTKGQAWLSDWELGLWGQLELPLTRCPWQGNEAS